jgi:tetratricopeptide (TPR) repeat protein
MSCGSWDVHRRMRQAEICFQPQHRFGICGGCRFHAVLGLLCVLWSTSCVFRDEAVQLAPQEFSGPVAQGDQGTSSRGSSGTVPEAGRMEEVPYERYDALAGAREAISRQEKDEVSASVRASVVPTVPAASGAGSVPSFSELIKAGHFQQALERIEAALADPNSTLAPFSELARLVLHVSLPGSDPLELLAASRRLPDLLVVSKDVLPPEERRTFSYFTEVVSALVLLRSGDTAAARAHLDIARDLDPEREEHCLLFARIWVDDREWGAAESALEQCQWTGKHNSPEFYALLAFIRQSRGKGSAGSLVLRRASDLYPEEPVLLLTAAQNEFARGNISRSCQHFESLYRSGQGGRVAAHSVAICALLRMDIQMSESVLEKSQMQHGPSPQGAQMLFGLYALDGRAETAMSAVRKGAEALSASDSVEFQSLAGRLVERLGTLAGALPATPAAVSLGGEGWERD